MYRTMLPFGGFTATAVLVISACTEKGRRTDGSNPVTDKAQEAASEKTPAAPEKTKPEQLETGEPEALGLRALTFRISGMT